MFSVKNFASVWNKFFFEERPTEGIAIFRIVWIGLIFCYYLLDAGNLTDFYGPQAIVSYDTTRSQFQHLQLNVFNLFVPSDEATKGLFVIYGMALFASLIGLFTRYSLIVSFILMTSFHQRNVWLLSSAEVLMRTITFYLIFSPCGHSLSFDNLLSKHYDQFKRPQVYPLWSWRLIQIQLSVVYLWTFWHKLKGDTWIDGTAVYYATRLETMTNFTIPYLMNSMGFLKFLTWSTLVLEFSIGTLIWFKEFRKPVILAGIAFHLGIELVMSIPFFELIMISLFINFFTPKEMKSFVEKIRSRIERTRFKERLLNTVRG